jgi:hypothetical protein
MHIGTKKDNCGFPQNLIPKQKLDFHNLLKKKCINIGQIQSLALELFVIMI